MVCTALLGLFGAGLVISSGKVLAFDTAYLQGYGLALLCGLIWSTFSVVLPLLQIRREPMTAYTLYAALLSILLFLLTGPHPLPSVHSMASAVYLGCVPLGLSFFLWNRALHGGNLVIIGFLSYLTPSLAVLLVAILHRQAVSAQVVLGMAVIIAASLGGRMRQRPIAAKDESGSR